MYKTLYEFFYEHTEASQRAALTEHLEYSDTDSITIGEATLTYFCYVFDQISDRGTNVSPYNSSEVNTLFCTYIYPKYKDMCIAYGDTEEELNENSMKFYRHLLNRIKTTYDENKVLIDAYNNEKSHLMDAIKTQSKFNDTPQTVTTAGVTTYDDTYNTTVNTSYNDGASKIARLNEIDNLIRDYYDRWMNMVVGGLFFYER